MSHSLIKQEDNKYSIWSSIVDNFIATDLTKEDVYNFYKEKGIQESIERTDYLFNKIGKAKFTPNTIDEALVIIKREHKRYNKTN